MANSVDPDQTAPVGAVCSGSTLFVSSFNSSVMLGNYLQQKTSADDIFRCIFFLGALRVKRCMHRFLVGLDYKNIRIHHECEGRIEKSVQRSPFGITRLAE